MLWAGVDRRWRAILGWRQLTFPVPATEPYPSAFFLSERCRIVLLWHYPFRRELAGGVLGMVHRSWGVHVEGNRHGRPERRATWV